jgi:hypothetical protein
MIEGIADAAEEIAQRIDLSNPTHVKDLRKLIERELTHFDVEEAYISVESEICAAAANAPDVEPSLDKKEASEQAVSESTWEFVPGKFRYKVNWFELTG